MIGTDSGHQMLFAPTQNDSKTTTTMLMASQNQDSYTQGGLTSTDSAVKKQYFDEIYHAK